MTDFYDVIIIGGGPAGLTASIYALREKLNVMIVEKFVPGGIAATTYMVENYPGFNGISGYELMQKFEMQAKELGLITVLESVEKIEVKDDIKIVHTPGGKEYRALSLIIASGTIHKKLNIPGESEFMGKGVSYCAICDGPLFKGKNVAVIGCGNSGIQEGLFLLKFVENVSFVEFLPYITADKILQAKIKDSKQVNFYLNHIVTGINGDNGIKSITIKDRESGDLKDINVDGVFIYTGLIPNTKFLKDVVDLDKSGYVIANEELETSVPGVFAAGDVRLKSLRQIVTAVADGAIAAFMAGKYVDSHETKGGKNV